MTAEQIAERLRRSRRPRGDRRRVLRIGGWTLALDGLEVSLALALDRRWGPFLTTPGESDRAAPVAGNRGEVSAADFHDGVEDAGAVRVEVFDGGASPWLEPRPGEGYRLEGDVTGDAVRVWSYRFAAEASRDRPTRWRVALSDSDAEPLERVVDNLARYLTARRAALAGGFALHGAGLLRDGRGWVFAGASGSGKTTAASVSAPSPALGDDFAIVVPGGARWTTAALPFDNRERVVDDPPRGWIPLAGVWRLYKAKTVRVEELPPGRGAASLMACTAFPWAMPDLVASVLDATSRFAATGLFHHLHFTRSPDFWGPVEASAGDD